MARTEEIEHYRTLERRHMIRAKDALAARLERLRAGESGDMEFVLACVAYLEFIVGRFVAQGRGNVVRLRAVIPDTDAAGRRTVDDIERTLGATRDQLDRLVAARDAAARGVTELDGFVAACREFVDFYDGTLARRKNPAQDIVDKYIDADTYWRQTDDVTPESIQTERALFHRLTALAPDLVQPDPD